MGLICVLSSLAIADGDRVAPVLSNGSSSVDSLDDISAKNLLSKLQQSVENNQDEVDSDITTVKSEASDKLDQVSDMKALVEESNNNYDRLISEANKILVEKSPSKSNKKIQEAENRLKLADEERLRKGEISVQADKLANSNKPKSDDISKEFHKAHDFYDRKSTRDYIDKQVKHYNRDYKVSEHDNPLETFETTREIAESFNQIDDEGDQYKYKLEDGYPMEEITTVGLLSGEKKRLKKCLIMKQYGGGTWQTYCQPLKRPTQCPEYDWKQLDTMAIMYC